MSNPLADMEKPDVIFCIGTNMTECHPVAATRIKRALARGAKLIVADPRRITLAEISDLYLPLQVGTDVSLLLGMAHVKECGTRCSKSMTATSASTYLHCVSVKTRMLSSAPAPTACRTVSASTPAPTCAWM